ncbi:hypothetical protein ACFL2Q_13375 [Thermodesulfobacteriota bacterium]
MPIRNTGTLLENIAPVAAMRLLNQDNHQYSPIDFLNSFAMPPLSVFMQHSTDCGFSEEDLIALQLSQQPGDVTSYESMLWSCLQQPPEQAGIQGPNGALLSAMLAHYLPCPLRLWLNDIPNGPYENAIPGLKGINGTVQQVLQLAEAPKNEVVVCDRRWPTSLLPPTEDNLTDTLGAWGDDAHARLGFLDPMRYCQNNVNGDVTDSSSHQQWLHLLADRYPRTVISVHFTGHRYWPGLRAEVQQMYRDGLAQGYHHALVASHSYYHVVCSIRHPDGENATRVLALRLEDAVRAAWNDWFRTIDRSRPAALNLAVL